jgi:hypothetical protein
LWAANLFNVHADLRARPSTWFVACFIPTLGPESKWDERGGNSKAVRNTELMMECNDCLYEGWNEQTCTTHLERWLDKSEVERELETYIRGIPEPRIIDFIFCAKRIVTRYTQF